MGDVREGGEAKVHEIKSVTLNAQGVAARAEREKKSSQATAEQRAKVIVRERAIERSKKLGLGY